MEKFKRELAIPTTEAPWLDGTHEERIWDYIRDKQEEFEGTGDGVVNLARVAAFLKATEELIMISKEFFDPFRAETAIWVTLNL